MNQMRYPHSISTRISRLVSLSDTTAADRSSFLFPPRSRGMTICAAVPLISSGEQLRSKFARRANRFGALGKSATPLGEETRACAAARFDVTESLAKTAQHVWSCVRWESTTLEVRMRVFFRNSTTGQRRKFGVCQFCSHWCPRHRY